MRRGWIEPPSARPVALRLSAFFVSGPRLSGRRPASAASPRAPVPLIGLSRRPAWVEGVMPATVPASSSHRGRSTPRAVPRSLPSAGCKPARRRRAHPHQRLAFRMAAPRGRGGGRLRAVWRAGITRVCHPRNGARQRSAAMTEDGHGDKRTEASGRFAAASLPA